jgi:hypothetical protein
LGIATQVKLRQGGIEAHVKGKRLILLISSVTVLAIIGILVRSAYWQRAQPTLRDGSVLTKAVQKYSQDCKLRGQTLPRSINLHDLIDGGYVSRNDVQVFDGMEVTISLSADETRPQDTLVDARLPNGEHIVVLGDGSVQQIRR